MQKTYSYRKNLTPALAKAIKNKKVLVLIDGANLYYSSYAKHFNIDFKQLYNWFNKNCILADCIYYTAFEAEAIKQTTFLENLETIGYKINKKPLKTFQDESKKGNLDVELTVDAVTLVTSYDILVLVSGDGDFTYLVQALEKFDRKVIILGVGGFMSFELHQEADNYFFLDRVKSIWQAPRPSRIKESKDPHPDIFLNLDIFGLFKKKPVDPEKKQINQLVKNVISKGKKVKPSVEKDYLNTTANKTKSKKKPEKESGARIFLG